LQEPRPGGVTDGPETSPHAMSLIGYKLPN